MRISVSFLVPWIVIGCGACDFSNGSKDEGGSDTGERRDSGIVDIWRAKGSGFVYLLDGEADHSRLVLEVDGTLTPRSGEGYYGWLLGGGIGHLLMGPFSVNEGTIAFEQDHGFNLFEDGYTSFEGYVSEDAPSSPGLGQPLWGGALPQGALDAITSLLVESAQTPSGEGSLRSVETALETIRSYAQAGIDNFTDLATCADTSEAIYNAIGASEEDIDHNGQVSTLTELELGIANSDPAITTHVSLIFDDLTTAFNALGGTSDIGDDERWAIGNAYDCIDRVYSYSSAARLRASIASCAAQSCCEMIFGNVIDELTLALDGEDLDEDGQVDLGSEGTVECGIEFVSRLLGFPVAVGFQEGQ